MRSGPSFSKSSCQNYPVFFSCIAVALGTTVWRGGPSRSEACWHFLNPLLLGSTINEAAYESAFKSMDQDRADALLVSNENEHFAYRAALVKLVAERRLPAMYPFRAIVESGGLMSYTADLVGLFRSLAVTVADILKGKKP